MSKTQQTVEMSFNSKNKPFNVELTQNGILLSKMSFQYRITK